MKIKRNNSFSITILLASAVGGLVTLAVASVLAITATSNFKNTTELMARSANQTIDSIAFQISSRLDPAKYVIEHIATQASNDNIDITDKHEMITTMRASLAAVPNLSGLSLWQADGRSLRVGRAGPNKIVVSVQTDTGNAKLRGFLDKLRKSKATVWAEPVRVNGISFISVSKAIFKDGALIGYIGAAISIDNLSSIIEAATARSELTGFIMYGDDHVLAHKSLPKLAQTNLTLKNPLHRADEITDFVLAKFAKTPPESLMVNAGDVDVRVIKSGDHTFLTLSRPYKIYGKTTWHIGVYAKRRELMTQLRRMVFSLAVGVGLLVLSVLAAIFLARRVARPIKQISTAATYIGSLDLDKIEPLPSSRITELNNQSHAFNKMLEGLKWFEAYVPRKLVSKLISENSDDAAASRQTELTVMFTDIIGFTRMSEKMTPQDIAQMLNEHFEVLNSCIEETGGTLDKYIGDAVMAFWGAPEEQEDHAERACRAALMIKEKFASLKSDIRIKIAIHTGPLIVGNIGAKGRMNYTIIGDTVNTASRIESLAGELAGDRQVFSLVSEDTFALASNKFLARPAGSFTVKGRRKKVKVLELLEKKTQ